MKLGALGISKLIMLLGLSSSGFSCPISSSDRLIEITFAESSDSLGDSGSNLEKSIGSKSIFFSTTSFCCGLVSGCHCGVPINSGGGSNGEWGEKGPSGGGSNGEWGENGPSGGGSNGEWGEKGGGSNGEWGENGKSGGGSNGE